VATEGEEWVPTGFQSALPQQKIQQRSAVKEGEEWASMEGGCFLLRLPAEQVVEAEAEGTSHW
jgi:hypothetical protein